MARHYAPLAWPIIANSRRAARLPHRSNIQNVTVGHPPPPSNDQRPTKGEGTTTPHDARAPARLGTADRVDVQHSGPRSTADGVREGGSASGRMRGVQRGVAQA